MSMTLQVPLPEELQKLVGGGNASEEQLQRWALEAMLLEAYRERLLSRGKLRELLDLSFQECEEFLAARGITYHYNIEELEADARTLNRVLGS